MIASRRFILSVLVVVSGVSAPVAAAQSEVARERRTLRGVDGFYLSLNTEGPASVQDSLDFNALHRRLRARLREAGLPVRPEGRVAAEDRVPYLHVHVNTVEAGRGLYPFGIQIGFYQAVRLTRDPATPTVAATWGAGIVGIASYDRLSLIPETALTLLEDFVEDFHRANP